MLSNRFENLIDEFPGEFAAIEKLEALVANSTSQNIYTFTRLLDKVEPSSTYYFQFLLTRAVQTGILEQVVRVESPVEGGIQDFDSLLEVPNEIFDSRQGINIAVTPDRIKTLYRVNLES